ncbi:MAG: SBBP repeat-containing protein [Candidatus Stahlbacteria bacterium]|nr:SBBP repeat-containing protein [Candidatus Stahlbacteria bacterium]
MKKDLGTLVIVIVMCISVKSAAQEWVARYNGPSNRGDYAYAIALDGMGNAYVTGYSWDSVTFSDYATIKYNSAGVEQWAARYDGNTSYDWAYAIAVDGMGNVYVTGYSWDSATSYDYTTIKYSGIGVEEEAKAINNNQLTVNNDWHLPVIKYCLPIASAVSLRVYDLVGREVAVLVDGVRDVGSYSLNWDTSTVPSGIYFVALTTGSHKESKKIIVVK